MNEKDSFCRGINASLACRACGETVLFTYWCETCQRRMPEKRCPLCGLKCRRIDSRAEVASN